VGADDHVYPNYIDVMLWLADSNLLEMIIDKLRPTVSFSLVSLFSVLPKLIFCGVFLWRWVFVTPPFGYLFCYCLVLLTFTIMLHLLLLVIVYICVLDCGYFSVPLAIFSIT